MNFLPHGNLPPKLEAACKQLEKLAGCPCLLFIMNDGQHFIANSTYEHLYRSRDQIRCSQKGEIALVLSSPGGDLHAAYKIGRFLRTRCKTLKVYVPHQAKSAATFLCLAANEIVLSDRSELGPLDSQHEAPDDPEKQVSALESFKALDAIRKFAFESLDRAVFFFEMRGEMTMTEALPKVTDFVGKIVDPLFRNFDVRKLGEYGRSLEVAQDYSLRIMSRFSYKDLNKVQLTSMITDLIWKYPSHGQVIDLDECRELGLHARGATDAENEVLYRISLNSSNLVYVGNISKSGEATHNGKKKAKPATGKGKKRKRKPGR